MTTQVMEAWTGKFGDEYQERNQATDRNVSVRVPLWEKVLMSMEPAFPQSVLEVGAGSGANLKALDIIYGRTVTPLTKFASDTNPVAIKNLNGLASAANCPAQNLLFEDNIADLVITSGLLIHIHPDDLLKVMAEIHRCSKRWIVCVEYFNPTPDTVPYRGQDGMLWRRDWGSFWQLNYPLKCLGSWFEWKPMTGLDNVTVWVLEKV